MLNVDYEKNPKTINADKNIKEMDFDKLDKKMEIRIENF